MVTSGFLVGLEKLSGDEYLQWKKDYPEAFARDYDPRYGPLFFGWVENPQRGFDRGEGGER